MKDWLEEHCHALYILWPQHLVLIARKCEEDTFGGLPRPSRTAAEVFSFRIKPEKGHHDRHGTVFDVWNVRSQEVLAVWSISPRMYCRSRVTTCPILTRSQDRTPVGGGFGTKLPTVIDSQTKTFKEKNEGCKMCFDSAWMLSYFVKL